MTKTSTLSVTISERQRQTVLNALTDKLVETKGYLRGSEAPASPGPEDSCCDAHLARYRYRRETYEALLAQRVHVEETIAAFSEGAESAASVTDSTGQVRDGNA